MSPSEWQMILGAASAFVGALAGVGCLAWWLAGQFRAVYIHVQQVKDHVVEKIGDHEKLDAERFENARLSIMRLELLAQGAGKGLHQI